MRRRHVELVSIRKKMLIIISHEAGAKGEFRCSTHFNIFCRKVFWSWRHADHKWHSFWHHPALELQRWVKSSLALTIKGKKRAVPGSLEEWGGFKNTIMCSAIHRSVPLPILSWQNCRDYLTRFRDSLPCILTAQVVYANAIKMPKLLHNGP